MFDCRNDKNRDEIFCIVKLLLVHCGKMVCIASRVDGKASYSDILKYCDKESSFININHNDTDKTIRNIYPSDGVSLAVKKKSAY